MPVRPPSLRSIAAFEAAARHRSFSKAADELNLTHGAVSHAIKALEKRLGQRLFDRTSRSVALTQDGRILASRVRMSLALLAEAFEISPGLRRSLLVVSMLPSFAEKIVIPRLQGFFAAHPDIQLDLRCTETLADLEGGEVDLAVRFGPGQWASLQSRHLLDEILFPVSSPDFNGGKLPTTVEELLACNLILHPESTWRLWLTPLELDDARIESTLRIDDSSLVLDAAMQGCGIALARASMVRGELAAGRLVRLLDHSVPAEYSYWLAWSAGSPRQKMIQAFADWLTGEMEAMHA